VPESLSSKSSHAKVAALSVQVLTKQARQFFAAPENKRPGKTLFFESFQHCDENFFHDLIRGS
jgi:hypothetical protein